MKVGDYVRTNHYGIRKVLKIGEFMGGPEYKVDEEKGYWALPVNIIKSSPNIIDLIEVGDYVNGVLVESIYQREKDKLYIHSFDTEIMMCFTNNIIKSIVTKEQFSQMEYRIGG